MKPISIGIKTALRFTPALNSGLRVSGKKDWYVTHFLNLARYVAGGDKFTACWQTLPASSLYQSLKSRLQAVPFWLVERVRALGTRLAFSPPLPKPPSARSLQLFRARIFCATSRITRKELLAVYSNQMKCATTFHSRLPVVITYFCKCAQPCK